MTRREFYYVGLIILVGLTLWVTTGCTISRLDRRSADEMRTASEYHYGEGRLPEESK